MDGARMAGMTIWPARRVRPRKGGSGLEEDRNETLRCGHQVAGRFDCQGYLGYLAIQEAGGPDEAAFLEYIGDAAGAGDARLAGPHRRVLAVLPHGMTEDPPGSGFWRQTARAKRRADRGLDASDRMPAPAAARRIGAAAVQSMPGTPVPFRRRCPTCGSTNEVTADLLSS